MGEVVGYVRVSTAEQHTDRQDAALTAAGAVRVFTDRASGKSTSGRPQLERCREWLREGDVLLVPSMDRLARSLPDLLAIVDELAERGVAVRFLREGVTVDPSGTDPISRLTLALLGAVAQFERELLLERQREGIRQARTRGAYRGRKPTDPAKLAEVRQLVASGVPLLSACRRVGVSRSVAYRAGIRAGIDGASLQPAAAAADLSPV